MLKVIPRPDLSEKYPAIDGIIKGERPPKELRKKDQSYFPAEQAVRNDVLSLLELSNESFANWYHHRKVAAKKLLEALEILEEIPDLRFGAMAINMGQSSIGKLTADLRATIDYLETIKEARERSTS